MKVFDILTENIIDILEKGGKGKGKSEGSFNSEELKKGIEIEKEHVVGNPDITDEEKTQIATKIAKDHLEEIPDYYTRLIKMEDEAKKENKQPEKESEFDKTIKEMVEADVVGTAGSGTVYSGDTYAPGDARKPTIIAPMMRRTFPELLLGGKKVKQWKRKKSKKSRKSKK